MELGQVIIDEIQRRVRTSRITIVVLSPAYKADRWAGFGEQIATYARIAMDDGRMVLPLLRADCDVPDDIAMLVGLDFRDSERETWSAQAVRVRKLLGRPVPVELDLPCPYPGMRPFTEKDAARFFGRDDELDDLIGRLERGEREIYVIGASGSGKSSLVAAGLVPRLNRQGEGDALVRSLRPGERPAARLAQLLEAEVAAPDAIEAAIGALLARYPTASQLLLVVDQLEELFSIALRDERAAFQDAVRTLRADPRCKLVLTLRADFYGAFMESTLWTDLGGRISRVELGAMRDDNLRAVIERPAGNLGVYLERDLVERLLGDTASEPGALPLLQETLRLLWSKRRQRLLALPDYLALGDGTCSGLARAVADRADTTLRQMTHAEEATALRILLRLVAFGEGRADTRRQQARSGLCSADESPAHFGAVLQRLVGAHLLTVTGDDDQEDVRVDLAHEILIHAWPTLAVWIQAWRTDEQYRRRLEDAAAIWRTWGSGERGLLEPGECAEAVAWRERAQQPLGESADATALIAASEAFHARSRRQRRRRVQIAFVALSLFVVVTSTLALAARGAASEADRQRRQADHERQDAVAQRRRANNRDRESRGLLSQYYQESGRQLLIDQERPLEALPYLLEARKLVDPADPSPSLRMLFAQATRNLPAATFEHRDVVNSVAFSPDGTRVVTASRDHTARVWDAVSGKPLSPPFQHQDSVVSATFSPDGTRVVTAGHDGAARVWDAISGKPLFSALQHQNSVERAMFTPDGTRIITTSEDTERIWDAVSGKPLLFPLQKQKSVERAVFSPDGTRVAIVRDDHTVRVWDAISGKPLSPPLPHQERVTSIAFNFDGTRVVTVVVGACMFTFVSPVISCVPVRVWDVVSGKPVSLQLWPVSRQVRSLLRQFQSWSKFSRSQLEESSFDLVQRATFSPDGTHVVTISHTGVRLWDATSGKPLPFRFREQDSRINVVTGVAFSPDGTRVIIATDNRTACVWDIASGKALSPPVQHQGFVNSAMFNPDGTRVVTASWDQTAHVWEVAFNNALSSPLQHQGVLASASFSPDGTRIVTASYDGTARVWDAASGKPLLSPLQHQESVVSAAFSPDGTRIVTASHDNTARIWDAASGKSLSSPFQHQKPVISAAFSPDGTRIVTASHDNTARVWDAASGKPLSPSLQHQKFVISAAFSHDGTRIVTASHDGTARIWDAASGKPLSPPLQHRGTVNSAAFSPDGTQVVTASYDGTARVWDAASGEPITLPLQYGGIVNSAAFSPDGTRVVTAGDEGARVWDTTSGKAISLLFHHTNNPLNSVRYATFSPNGTRVVTAGHDGTARIWDVSLASGTLASWNTIVDRASPYVLVQGVLSPRVPMSTPDTSATPAVPTPSMSTR